MVGVDNVSVVPRMVNSVIGAMLPGVVLSTRNMLFTRPVAEEAVIVDAPLEKTDVKVTGMLVAVRVRFEIRLVGMELS